MCPVTAWYIAIPVIIIAGTAFVWVTTRGKGHRQKTRFGTAPRVQPPVRGLPAAGTLAADYASLATPCWRCDTDHIGDCPPWAAAAPARPPGHVDAAGRAATRTAAACQARAGMAAQAHARTGASNLT